MRPLPKKMEILGTPRAGTTYLYAVLAQHHAAVHNSDFAGEPFNVRFHHQKHFTMRNPLPYENDWLKIKTNVEMRVDYLKVNEADVIKNHIGHYSTLNAIFPRRLVDEMKAINYYRIMLYRKDLFKASVSHALARATQQWARYDSNVRMTIPIQRFKEALNYINASNYELFSNRYNIKYDQIVAYEDLLFDPSYEMQHLGFDSPMTGKKLNNIWVQKAPPKTESVLNYKELYDYTVSEYIPYLDDTYYQFMGTKMTNIRINNAQ